MPNRNTHIVKDPLIFKGTEIVSSDRRTGFFNAPVTAGHVTGILRKTLLLLPVPQHKEGVRAYPGYAPDGHTVDLLGDGGNNGVGQAASLISSRFA